MILVLIKFTAENNFYDFLGNRGLKGDSGTCPESCTFSNNITRLQRDLRGNVCICIFLYFYYTLPFV